MIICDPWQYGHVKKSFAQRNANGHCMDFVRLGMKYDLAEFRACWKYGRQHLMQRVRDKRHSWGDGGFADIMPSSLAQSRVLQGEALKLVSQMVDLRMKLGPEILDLARHSAKTGEPMMRYMAYAFPGEGLETVMDQYMLGEKYMVTPVMTKGATSRSVKFPRGTWRSDDGGTVTGPCEMEVQAPLSKLPWYTRVG
jgi:hypothetical protein